MHVHSEGARSSDAYALLENLLAAPPQTPRTLAPAPWAAPARLGPLPQTGRRSRAARNVAVRRGAAVPGNSFGRPLAVAATVLLAGGIVASSVGAAPVRASLAVVPSIATAPAAMAASGALGSVRVAAAAPTANRALLARLLAAPTSSDEALLSRLLAAPAAPAALPAFELTEQAVAASAVLAAPVALRFQRVTQLPSAAFAYQVAAVSLPQITLADQVIAPPAPPPGRTAQGQQPPPPPGYRQPPGYQDGVPFGGQIGAVPGSQPGRPAGGGRPTTRPVVAAVYVVRVGDTLSTIALRFYGDARYAGTIWEANYRIIGANPNAIFPGQRLTLPGTTARPIVAVPLPVRGPIGQRANYTIQPRDFLRWIAQRAYGTEIFWPEIYHANRNVLGPNPDLIYPGVKVYIP